MHFSPYLSFNRVWASRVYVLGCMCLNATYAGIKGLRNYMCVMLTTVLSGLVVQVCMQVVLISCSYSRTCDVQITCSVRL